MANEALRMDLFGPSPAEVMQARQGQNYDQAMAWGQVDPLRSGQISGAMAGQAFGQALGGALGGQDPAYEKAQRMQMAQMETEEFARANGIDLATKPQDYYRLATQTLSKYGLANEAAQVAEIARMTALQEREMRVKEQATNYSGIRAQASLLKAMGEGSSNKSILTLVPPGNNQKTGEGAKTFNLSDPAQRQQAATLMQQGYIDLSKLPAPPSPGNSVYVSPGEETLDKELAKIGAGELGGLTTSSALGNYNSGIDASRRILDLAQDPNIKIGAGAEVALAASKLFNITGANNSEIIAKTQVLAQNLAKVTLANIKNSGLGTGQGFTDKDLKFLERASAGDISFDKDSIIEFALSNMRGQRRWMEHRNKTLSRLPPETMAKMARAGLDTEIYELPVIPDIQTSVTAPKPSPSKGSSKAPEGVRQELWDVMPEDKKALWRQ